ncbi:hypothetical protein GS597_05395 [Synechococcales cyanobacterium C]|uniref:DALR anticodon binding domain-containing protein n=1 Tax=Petrachloros mirabilis ULC683 TaxID=2781853 RepID=A0A8K1ZXL7_9CYAN|nr:DALR anticodon-binding domain-containing protein [Petrachloros mirabilis]NCJ05956.1 hypothetical protein [Petrachloros mirabilis ULC683]
MGSVPKFPLLPTHWIDYPSPATALIHHLGQAIAQQQIHRPAAPWSVPIYMTDLGEWRSSLVLERSGLGQGLSWGRQLLSDLGSFSCSQVNSTAQGAGGWTFWLQSPGWLHARLPPWALALCLQGLMRTPPQLRPAPAQNRPCLESSHSNRTEIEAAVLDGLQYAHARCCHLLHLGAETGLIALAFQDGYPLLLDPLAQLPWLDANQQLWCSHPAEVALLRSLLQFPASLQRQNRYYLPISSTQIALCSPPAQYLGQYLGNLVEQFAQFHRLCNIFGEVKHQHPNQATARLGLLLILQPVLAFVLRSLLAAEAPTEA